MRGRRTGASLSEKARRRPPPSTRYLRMLFIHRGFLTASRAYPVHCVMSRYAQIPSKASLCPRATVCCREVSGPIGGGCWEVGPQKSDRVRPERAEDRSKGAGSICSPLCLILVLSSALGPRVGIETCHGNFARRRPDATACEAAVGVAQVLSWKRGDRYARCSCSDPRGF